MILIVVLTPFICLALIKVSKDRLQATVLSISALIIASIIDYNLSSDFHAHNPLGNMTGSFMMLLIGGPLILVGLSFKKQKPKQSKKNENSER